MLKPYKFCATFLLLIFSITNAQAQGDRTRSDKPDAPTITASASGDSVRFTAPPSIVQTRLEVYDSTGKKVFDNEVRGGNVVDWRLQDGQAAPLADDTYLCTITVKSLAGKLTQRIGAVIIQSGTATVRAVDASQMTAQQSQAIGPVDENPSLSVVSGDETLTTTLIAHNGEEGQLTRGQGALSFRLGDFFRGKDIEQMRLTPEGNLGIGVANPQAKLDVAGAIRASQGIIFPDGSIQFSAAKKTFGAPSLRDGQSKDKSGEGQGIRPEIAGTGTTGKIPKWQDGPNGILTDSVITELNGSIGINGAPNSTYKLDVNGHNRFRGSNVSFYLTGTKAGGNEWLFQTVDADGRLRIFENSTGGGERLSLTQSGNVGIGTASPNSRLTVGGMIESTSGGFKFPDGTTQTTAAAGGGGLTLPFSGSTSSGSTALAVTNNGSGEGVFGKGRNGVHGQSPSATDSAVWGESVGNGYGVSGSTFSNGTVSISPAGVWGHNSSSGFGVKGTSAGIGVIGFSDGIGVKGESTNGFAVKGESTNGVGVRGNSTGSNGVVGSSINNDGVFGIGGKNGVHGQSNSPDNSGVWGENVGGGYGVAGSTNTTAASGKAGVVGQNFGDGPGVKGTSGNGFGVAGYTTNGAGVYGDNGNSNTTGHAGYFNGRVAITGNLAANNLPGLAFHQEHTGSGTTYDSEKDVDSVSINVPAPGFLVISAVVNVRTSSGESLNVDFKLFNDSASGAELTRTTVQNYVPNGTDPLQDNAHLSWVLEVPSAGSITLRTHLSELTGGTNSYYDHNLTAVYVPRQL